MLPFPSPCDLLLSRHLDIPPTRIDHQRLVQLTIWRPPPPPAHQQIINSTQLSHYSCTIFLARGLISIGQYTTVSQCPCTNSVTTRRPFLDQKLHHFRPTRIDQLLPATNLFIFVKSRIHQFINTKTTTTTCSHHHEHHHHQEQHHHHHQPLRA